MHLPEVESSRTHFKVLGLGLKGQVLGLGFGDRPKNFCEDLFFFLEIA